jgi:hypothetical protein
MAPKKVNPRKYHMTTNQLRGSWWFLLISSDGEESLVHCSTATTIAEVIQKGKGHPDTHVAKFGSKVLDNARCLDEYKINTNGSRILGDTDWDGKSAFFFKFNRTQGQLSVVQVTGKNVLVNVMTKLGMGKKAGENSVGTPIKLEFYIAEAINLPGVDSSGTSDPYVVLSLKSNGGEHTEKPITAKSATIMKNVNPQWKETLSLEGPWLAEENYKDMSMFIQVYDANRISKDVSLLYFFMVTCRYLSEMRR